MLRDYVTGVLTQFRDDERVLGWDLWNEPDNPANQYREVERKDKIERVAHFHQNTLKALAELIAAAGLNHPQELRPHHLVRRISPNQVRLASALLPFLEPGQLLDPDQLPKLPPVFALYWPKAQAESFKSLD